MLSTHCWMSCASYEHRKGIIRITVMIGTHVYGVLSIRPALPEHFTGKASFHSYNNSVRKALLFVPFYRWVHENPERVSNFLKVTQLVNGI